MKKSDYVEIEETGYALNKTYLIKLIDGSTHEVKVEPIIQDDYLANIGVFFENWVVGSGSFRAQDLHYDVLSQRSILTTEDLFIEKDKILWSKKISETPVSVSRKVFKRR